MQPFKRLLNPGSGDCGQVFVRIDWDGERLSLVGVEGPKQNGDARGSSGQCVDFDASTPNPPWTPERIERLRELWEQWHLNDMRAGCEHQRAAGWGSETVEIVTYKLTSEAYQLRKKAEEKASAAAVRGEVADLDDTEKALLSPDDRFRGRFEPPDADSPLSGCFEVRKRESKCTGWVRPDEHPRGVLRKPCPECGYKYGTARRTEPVPDAVLEELAALPESERGCPWRDF